MYIHHIALWTTQLEELRQFYITYFNGTSNEMMRKTDVTSPADKIPHIGLAHFSVSAGSKEAVLELTERLRHNGFVVASEPRTTGDGFFESAILDPDGNLVEITI